MFYKIDHRLYLSKWTNIFNYEWNKKVFYFYPEVFDVGGIFFWASFRRLNVRIGPDVWIGLNVLPDEELKV